MAGKVSGRIKRAITSSLVLLAVAIVLAASNAYILRRDRQLAVGPESRAQEEFFANAVDRPDIVAFFKRFTPTEKLQAARNLSRYENPQMVRLAAVWLSDFDSNARDALAEVLGGFAPKFPEVVAEQLGHTGGFQKVAVFSALRKWEDKTLPTVVNQLNVPERRANTVEYLAGVGAKAGPFLVRKLADKDREVRLAAADALGRIAYRPAAQEVRNLLHREGSADRSAILASLANLGDPASEPIFAQMLSNPNLATAERAIAFLGLSRIGSPSAVATLASEARRSPPDKTQILESLSLAGDNGLEADLDSADLLEVAGRIKGSKADQVVVLALSDLQTRDRAAELAFGRPGAAASLAAALAKIGPNPPGATIERMVKSLASTSEGRSAFERLRLGERYRGYMLREAALAN